MVEGEAVVSLLSLLKKSFYVVSVNKALPIIVGCYVGSTAGKLLITKNSSKYSGCLINNKIFYDEATLEERKKNVEKTKIRVLLPYVQKLAKSVDESLLVDMYRNLSTAKASFSPLLAIGSAEGSYNPKTNEIEYFFKSSIGHELLHLSSSYYDKKNKEIHSGFSQSRDYATIGCGLNEGYTELLASRMFNKNNKVETYKRNVRVARLLELFFVDPEDMQKYYFRHNLPGYVKYMEEFIPRKKFIKMLFDLDIMHRFTFTIPFVPTYKSISVELELYKYFLKTNPSKEKRKAFESIIKETKIGKMALDRTKMKLYKENWHNRSINDDGLEIYHHSKAM